MNKVSDATLIHRHYISKAWINSDLNNLSRIESFAKHNDRKQETGIFSTKLPYFHHIETNLCIFLLYPMSTNE